MLAAGGKFLDHVKRVRESVLAMALPDDTQYMQLHQQTQLLSADPESDALQPVPLDFFSAREPERQRRLDHEVVLEVKSSLATPLDGSAVQHAWCRTSLVLPLVFGAVLALVLTAWLVMTK